MLQAFYKKKTRFHERYRSSPGKENGRIAAEDEIASLVLGPLQFMAPESSIGFWRALLAQAGWRDFLPDRPPSEIKFELWPSFSDSNGSRVEPDAMIRYEWSNGEVRVIVLELKWGAGLSGEFQLQRQWQSCFSESDRAHALHVFIGHDLSECIASKMVRDVWRDGPLSRLVMLRWVDVRTALACLKNGRRQQADWAIQADEFLQGVNVSRFSGFGWVLDEEPVRIVVSTRTGDGVELTAKGYQARCLPNVNLIVGKSGLEGVMEKASGKLSVGEVFDLADRLGGSIDQLLYSLADSFVKAIARLGKDIDCALKAKGRRVEYFSHQNTRNHWTFNNCSVSVGIGRHDGRSKVKAYVSFQVALAGDTLPEDARDPLLHVHLWEDPVDFNESDYCYFAFDTEESYRPETFGKLLTWTPEWSEGNEPWSRKTWTFSVNLMDLNSDADIKRLVMDPVMALLAGKDIDVSLPDVLIHEGLFLHSEDKFRNPGAWCEE